MRTYYGARVRPDGRFDIRCVYPAQMVCRDNGELCTVLRLHKIKRPKYRIVFHCGGDDMVSRCQAAAYGYVQCLSGV